MAGAYVAGAGQTDFGRAGDESIVDLAAAAAEEALADAGIGAGEVDGIYLGNFAGLRLGGQGFCAAVVAERLRLGGSYALAVEGACASGGLAFAEGVGAVEGGRHGTVLIVGAEKMTDQPTAEVTDALARAADTGSHGFRAGLTFPGFFALLARRYLHEYELEAELLAAVSVKNRAFGARNPKAHFGTPVERGKAIAARPIADPLRLFDCSPISDGAAALVVSERPDPSREPIEVRACEQARGPVSAESMDSFLGLPAAAAAGRAALAAADAEIADVDVIEAHDCFSIAEWIALEDLGVFERGEAAVATADGETGLGGRVCVNPSGGLLAKGHPVGATGVAQLKELVDQLRARAPNQVEDVDLALAHNVGGTGGVAVVSILGRG